MTIYTFHEGENEVVAIVADMDEDTVIARLLVDTCGYTVQTITTDEKAGKVEIIASRSIELGAKTS